MAQYQYESSSNQDSFYPPPTIRNVPPLWTDSQITGKFVAPHLSFSKEKRFKWSSIYWPEDTDRLFAVKKKRKSDVIETAQRISKMIDDEEKNQARIRQIKRTFSIGKSSINSGRREAGVILSTKKPFKLSKQNEEILMRLTPRQQRKQSLRRDRHGNRCNLYEDPQQVPRQDANKLYSSTGFKTSKKMNLDLPHNFNPGPGTYEIKRYLAELEHKGTKHHKNLRSKEQKTVG